MPRLDFRAALSQRRDPKETSVAAGVLNHPANGVAWLANNAPTMSAKPGRDHPRRLVHPRCRRAKGDTFHVDYGSMESDRCRFV